MRACDPPNNLDASIPRLVEALHDMRDALVKASLLLKDAQLELESVERTEVDRQFQDLIDKVSSK